MHKERVVKSKFTNASLKKNCTSRENRTLNNFNITKTKNSDTSISTNNLLMQSSQIPNFQLKIDDEIYDHVSNVSSYKDSIYNDENCDKLETPLNDLDDYSRKFIETYNELFFDK